LSVQGPVCLHFCDDHPGLVFGASSRSSRPPVHSRISRWPTCRPICTNFPRPCNRPVCAPPVNTSSIGFCFNLCTTPHSRLSPGPPLFPDVGVARSTPIRSVTIEVNLNFCPIVGPLFAGPSNPPIPFSGSGRVLNPPPHPFFCPCCLQFAVRLPF